MPFHDPFIASPAVRRWTFSVLAIALVLLGLLDVRLRSRPGDFTTNDYTVFYSAAAALYSGGDPYAARNIIGDRYLYPPLLAIIMTPLVPLGSEWSGALWFFINAGLAFACYFLLAAITSRVVTRVPAWLALAPISAVALPGISSLQAGQLGIILLCLVLAALHQFISGRIALSALLFSAGAALKLLPALPAALLLVHLISNRRYREAMRFCASFAAGMFLWWIAIPSAVVGVAENFRMLRVFYVGTVLERAEMNIESIGNQSPWYALERLFGDAGSAAALAIAAALIILLIAVVARAGPSSLAASVASDQPRGGALRAPAALVVAAVAGIGGAAAVSLSPVAWAHYFVLLVAAVLFVPLLILQRGNERLARALALVPPAVVISHYLLRLIEPGCAILGLGMTAWVLVATFAVARELQSADERATTLSNSGW